MATEIRIINGQAWLIDTSILDDFFKIKSIPMILTPPEPNKLWMQNLIDHGPVLRTPASFIIGDISSDGPDPFEFKFLFPLGKRGYVKK